MLVPRQVKELCIPVGCEEPAKEKPKEPPKEEEEEEDEETRKAKVAKREAKARLGDPRSLQLFGVSCCRFGISTFRNLQILWWSPASMCTRTENSCELIA